jgi:hypothetical protein
MTNQPVPTTVPAPTTGARSPLAVWSLVLGLTSIVFGFTFVVPIAGLVCGILSRRREPEGRTMALVGIVSSVVMLVGTVIALVIGLAVVGGAGLLALLPGTAG